MAERYVQYEEHDSVIVIRMNRPERRNSMSAELTEDLAEAEERFKNDANARVAILTGVGNSFNAGMDLREAREQGESGAGTIVRPAQRAVFEPGNLDKPIIAAINGWALGAGMVLALRTDLRVIAEDARMGMWEIRRGFPAGWGFGATHGLSTVGAAEIAYGYDFSAERALALGLVNRVVPRDDLMDTAMEMAEFLTTLPPLAVAATKDLLRQASQSIPAELAQHATEVSQRLRGTRDALESLRAFAEKRKPVYEGH